MDYAVIKAINPRRIFLLVEDINVIHDRLLTRDGMDYSLNLLSEMSAKEQELAENFSTQYDVPLLILRADEYDKVDTIVKEFGKEYMD